MTLVRIGGNHPETFPLRLGGLERAHTGAARDREHDVRALIVLGERELLAKVGIFKRVRVADDDVDIRGDTHHTGDKANFVAHYRRNPDSPDNADLALFTGQKSVSYTHLRAHETVLD